MNIIVVDDEPFFIEQLKKKLAMLSEELQTELIVTSECYNGKEALEAIARETPDAVFTDIRMTAMNGIELAKAIRERHPDLPIVILSAYPSFEYLREAMRFNVTDYLVKPIDAPALQEIVEKLVANAENRSYLKAQKTLLTILVSPTLPSEAEQTARVRLPYPFYRAFFINNIESVHEYPVLAPSSDEDDKRLIYELGQILSGGELSWIFPLDDGRSRLLVLGLNDNGENKLPALFDALSKHYSRGGAGPSVVYSAAFPDILRLNKLVTALRTCLSERLVIGKALYLTASDTEPDRHASVPDTDIEKSKLDRLLTARDYGGAIELIRSLFRIWEKYDCPTAVLGMQLRDIVHRIENQEKKPTKLGFRNWEARIEEQLQTARSFPELAEGFIAMLSQMFEQETTGNWSQDLSQLFARIEAYIASHIGQPLSLPLLTEQFHISKTLLCNLFRDYSGKSFVEYVTALRMHKAQELMIHYPRMRNKEIAEMIGYFDQNYFSRVFTSVIGMSPSEFRARSGSETL
ncbi:response regulator transcription factor [Cohnella silvisoli]|uniref:Response regulator n=1 Tax=Cohnella silvisoli TaxID=2873699 RepID=A0ABV1KRQ4_9BACL|nr:response regulator [Cohnella silvisoli]MCD9022484.1 response regulator [Cohnella silvisoli]